MAAKSRLGSSIERPDGVGVLPHVDNSAYIWSCPCGSSSILFPDPEGEEPSSSSTLVELSSSLMLSAPISCIELIESCLISGEGGNCGVRFSAYPLPFAFLREKIKKASKDRAEIPINPTPTPMPILASRPIPEEWFSPAVAFHGIGTRFGCSTSSNRA